MPVEDVWNYAQADILQCKSLQTLGLSCGKPLTLVINGDGEPNAKITGIGSLRPRFETDFEKLKKRKKNENAQTEGFFTD